MVLLLEEPASDDGRPTFRKSDKFVYTEAVLLRSWFALRNFDKITQDDVDILIAQVYDSEPEAIAAREREWIMAADEQVRKKIFQEEGEAKARMIHSPESECFPDMLPSTGGILEEDDPQVHRTLQALTRLGPPGISVVCLHRVGDKVFLDSEALALVDLAAVPTPESRRALVQASVSVSNHVVYTYFANQPTPSAWRKDPVLRHMRAVELIQGGFNGPGFTLILDPKLGLLIETRRAKEDDNGKT
jgi:hypothetical protein